MSDYTPTTEQVRATYLGGTLIEFREEGFGRFQRWLAKFEHEAEARGEARASALNPRGGAIRAGALSGGHIGKSVEVRANHVSATGTLTNIWHTEKIGSGERHPQRASINLKLDGGEIKLNLLVDDLVVLHDDE